MANELRYVHEAGNFHWVKSGGERDLVIEKLIDLEHSLSVDHVSLGNQDSTRLPSSFHESFGCQLSAHQRKYNQFLAAS